MELIRINDVVQDLNVSSRTLRYYEQVGLLRSYHPENKRQRYYDDAEIERLKQILILRKLQIPIKDIQRIFESGDLSELTASFIKRITQIDDEIDKLHELRALVDEFLQQMKQRGIKKISAIPLLYEETEKRLKVIEPTSRYTRQRLKEITKNKLKTHDVRVFRLPRMKMITSDYKDHGNHDEPNIAHDMFLQYGVRANPGLRDGFYVKKRNDLWILMIRIDDHFENTTPYKDLVFEGGLFAVTTSFLEDVDQQSQLLIEYIDESDLYDIDCDAHGKWRCDLMVEEILPVDISHKLNRYQQDIFIPIRMNF